MKKKIEKWYKQGLWSKSMVADAVAKKLITPEEYGEITGESITDVSSEPEGA